MDTDMKRNMIALEQRTSGRARRASEYRLPGPGHYNVDYSKVEPKSDKVGFILQEYLDSEPATSKMREFFALLLVWHGVCDAKKLWDEDWEKFGRRFLRDGCSRESARGKALCLVGDALRFFGLESERMKL